MPILTFKGVIKIYSKKGYKFDTAVEMPKEAGEEFTDSVFDLLTKLYLTTTGKKIIDDIDAAGKDVIIFCADVGNGSAANPHPGTVENEMQRFVRLRQIPDAAIAKLRKENSRAVIPEAAYYAAEVHAVLTKSKVNRDVLSKILGLSKEDIVKVERGELAFNDQQYFRFALFLYPHLTPGAGCSVALRFEAAQANQDPNDTELIILGHELIHTWRMVTGMRIFAGGWEEEAMTVGLPPFINMGVTENKLRIEIPKPMRTSYTTRCTTNHFQVVKDLDGAKGIWPEQLRKWEEWKAMNPKLATQKITVTKKSIFTRG